ncbi:hypothetical protein [Paremcibacter congregatus]|uniref:hypothetical protein n=1 Tax=Paremcibacter congregatus TaxID=2043170 RepID=UPI0030EC35E5|tara:strand:- start:2196 stop:2534 length:339 start_codon:yes stop_codon:yes gene_type:complete
MKDYTVWQEFLVLVLFITGLRRWVPIKYYCEAHDELLNTWVDYNQPVRITQSGVYIDNFWLHPKKYYGKCGTEQRFHAHPSRAVRKKFAGYVAQCAAKETTRLAQHQNPDQI